jgi:hypothetical protein
MGGRTCWIEARLEGLDTSTIVEWLLGQSHLIWNNITELQSDHITLIYGFKEHSIDKIINIVGVDHTMEIEFDSIEMGKINPSIELLIKSIKMRNLFWKIRKTVPDCTHNLINGLYTPHITICHLKKFIDKDVLKDPHKLNGQKITVKFVVKVGDGE